jgi:hypothetical protein
MRMPSRWSFPALALAAGLATILVVLAVLQYEWSGQVSDAQRERMQATLRTAMNEFREDLRHELAGVCAAFEMDAGNVSTAVEQGYAERYQEWRRKPTYPDLVANVFLWETHAPYPRLVHLNPRSGQFESADCPSRFGELCRELGLKRLEPPNLPGSGSLPFTWTLEGTIPALVHPLFRARERREQRAPEVELAGHLVIELSQTCLQKQVFADLVQRYFGKCGRSGVSSGGIEWQRFDECNLPLRSGLA